MDMVPKWEHYRGMGTQARNSSADARVLADSILDLMESEHLTRADLHRKTGMASSTLYDKLRNRPHALNVGELGRIAHALDVPLTILLGKEG